MPGTARRSEASFVAASSIVVSEVMSADAGRVAGRGGPDAVSVLGAGRAASVVGAAAGVVETAWMALSAAAIAASAAAVVSMRVGDVGGDAPHAAPVGSGDAAARGAGGAFSPRVHTAAHAH